MLRQSFRSVLRSLRRNPGYAFINIFGLAIGLGVSILLLLWVSDELSYDRFWKDADRIHRVKRTVTRGEMVSTTNAVTTELDHVLDEDYPGIERAAIVGWKQDIALTLGDLAFRRSGRYVGVDFFRIFEHRFLAGDPVEAVRVPESIVLTESVARAFFPDVWETADGETSRRAAASETVGRTMSLENRLDVTVTGIIGDVPLNTVVDFDFVLPYEEYARRNAWVEGWGNNGFQMFVKLTPGVDHRAVSDRIRMVVQEHMPTSTSVLFLQPIEEAYLYSEFENGVQAGGRIDYVRIFSLVGIMILLIACINYTNLATARSGRRAVEIGVRKTFGAERRALVRQIIGESVVTALPALLLALLGVWLLLPRFNALTGKKVTLDLLDPTTALLVGGVTLSIGVLAGAWPALYLSGMNIVRIQRGHARSIRSGAGLRRTLVVLQFTASAILIVGTLTVYRQLTFIQTKNLGLDRGHVFRAELLGEARDRFNAFKQELLEEPGIRSVTFGWGDPFSVNNSTSDPEYDGKDPDDNTRFFMAPSGYNFIETMGMELVAGRDFSKDRPADTSNVIINETMAQHMGFDDPLGQRLDVWGREGSVIGVVRDFHHSSLYRPIEPTIIRLDPQAFGYVYVRVAPERTRRALHHFEDVHAAFNPGNPLDVAFLEDKYDEMYRSERIMQTLARFFAFIAIVLAGLGLLGLASFMAERRRREVGIRKVLGASVSGLFVLLTREFVVLVLAAMAVAVPISVFFMNRWLGQFEYSSGIGWMPFAVTAAILLVATYLTVGYQSVRAALANPADAIRSE